MTHIQHIEIAIFAYALLIIFHFRGIDIFEKTISIYTRYVTRSHFVVKKLTAAK